MALSIEERLRRAKQNAKKQEEFTAQVTARVAANAQKEREQNKTEYRQPQAPAYPKETIQAVSQAARKPFSVNQLTDIFQSGTMKRPALDVERPKVETQQNATTDYDKLLKEKYAQLENTAPSNNLNDPTRYNLMQEIRQLEQQKADWEKAEAERRKAVGWEAKQQAGIRATGDETLPDDLKRLRDLKVELDKAASQSMNSPMASIRMNEAQKEYAALQRELQAKYGEKLDGWQSYVSRVSNQEDAEKMQEELSEKAKEKPFWMSAATLPVNLASGLGIVDVAGQKAQRLLTGSDVPIDYNTPGMRPAQFTNAVRGSVSEKIEEDTAGKFGSDTALGNLYSGAYNLGMSMGDSAIGLLTGSSMFMAGSAATNAMLEAKERGATDNQALLFGLASGAMEGVMEKLSIDSLLSAKDPKIPRQLFLGVLEQGGVEGLEELNTNLATTLADAIIMGDKSQLNTTKNYYIQQGHSPEEAEKLAKQEWGKSLALDAVGGFISGGLFEMAKGVPGYISNNLQNQQPKSKPIDNTWTPEQKANLDRWLDDWMQEGRDPAAAVTQGVLDAEGHKKTTASETITGSPMNGPERSNAAVGTEANIAQEVSPFNEEWQKFLDKHKGQPSVSDYLEFGRQLGEDVDANAFMEFLDQQEQEGKLKWRSDGAPGRVMPAEDHIDQRDYSTVGNPKVKSFQYNNPELRPFIQEGLQVLADDLAHSYPGERYYNGLDPNGYGSQGLWSGQKRHTTPDIARLKDDYHMSWEDINKAYEDLMEDQGRENNAKAKRLELLVDGILTNGHRTLGGVEVPPNQEYIEAKSKIAGYSPKAKPTSGIDEDFMRYEFGESFDDGAVGNMNAVDNEANTAKLSPSQAQMFNIMTSNIAAEARRNNISLEEYYNATGKINAFSPTKADVKLVSDLLEPIVEQLDEKNLYGYLDKMRSYYSESTESAQQATRNENAKPAMGAADYGFAPYSNYQNTQSDFLPEGANPARPVDMPATDPTGRPTRRGAKTLYGAEITSDARAEQMELEFMRGVYGYNVKTNQAAVDNARATIESEGYDKSYGRVTERLRDLKDLKQTMTEAILLYNNAVQTGNDTDAAELALLISMSGTEGGQLVQTFSMFRQLTPEGQLAGIQRVTDKINEKVYGKRKDGNPIPEHQRQDVEKTVDDVRETALRLLENIHQAFSGDNHGVPVENWLAEIGDKLAKTMDSNKTGRNRTPNPTIAKTIQKDLERFAKGYMDKVKPGNQYSNAKALENFLNNPDQYSEAWDTARRTLREKYKDNPEMLDALNDFLASGIDMEQMGHGIDNDIKKALSDIGVKTSELIRKSDADKTEVASKIADMLMKDHQLSEVDANTMASFILERFNRIVAERSEAALKQRFGKKDKKQKKTFNQDFTELANMGAFTNANWKDAVTEKLFGHEITIEPKLVEQFRNAPDQKTRDTIMEKIYENVGQQIPTTFGEAANQWRYTSMLLAPSTHLKNMGGNLSMMAMKLGKDAVGAGLESATNAAIGAVNKVTNGKYGNTKIDRTKSILNVFSKNDQKLLQMAWDDFVNVEEDVKGIGKNKDNAMGKIGEYRDYWKINDPKSNAAKLTDKVLRAAESVPKANSNAMDVEDRIFSKPDYAISLAGYMKANNLTEITPEARLYAIKEAQKATFRDANPVSEFAKRAGNSNHKFWNGIVNAIFPFKGTPANVGVRAVEYSPAGFLTAIAKAKKAAKDGTFKAADFIDDMSAAFVGSGLLVAGYFLAQNDWLRATGVGDEKEKAAQKEDGYKDHSFKLFGYSVPETVFTSASTPMFVGAALYEALATKALDGEAYTIDDVLQAFSTTIDPILGQTMLDGLSDVLYSVRSTQGGIGEYVGSIGINIVGNYLASFIPTLLSRVSAAADGVSRETYTDKNKPLPKVQKEIQDLMMKTPLRTKLPEKVDNYGRTQENWLSGGDSAVAKVVGGIANVATPTFPSKIKTTDVGETLQELYRSGADTEGMRVFQTEAPKSFKADGKQVHLTSEQYETFEKSRGDNTMLYQGVLQNDASFDAMESDAQIYATDKMYDFIDQMSKAELDVGYKPQDWVAELQGKSPEEVAEAIVKKTFESIASDKNQYANKYAGLGDLLEAGTIGESVAASLLPEKQQTGYFDHIQGSGISMDKYLDVIAYYNTDGIKQPEVKAYIEKNFSSKADRIRVWKCFYSENTIPKEW